MPIRVQNVNRPAEIVEIANQNVARGETLNLTVNTSDADNDRVTITGTSIGGFGLPEFVSLTDNDDGTANFVITPTDKDRGDYVIVIEATDEANNVTESSFVVTVEAENDRPLLDYIGDKVAIVGETLEFTIDVDDLDEDDLTFSTVGLPARATLTPSNIYGKAIFSWLPTVDDIGNYPLTIKVEDSGNGDSQQILSSEETFNIIVRTENNAPTFNQDEGGGMNDEGVVDIESIVSIDDILTNTNPITLFENNITFTESDTLFFNLSANDIDGDSLTYTATNLPPNSQLNSVTGEFSFTPNYFQSGIYNDVIFTVSDGNKSDTVTINIIVENKNRSPILTLLPLQATREDRELIFDIKATDIDNDSITYNAINLPDGARLNPVTGKFQWQPNYNQAGNYTIEVTATDDNGSSDDMTVNIIVDNVNRLPSIDVSPQIVALGETLRFNLFGDDADITETIDNNNNNNVQQLKYSAINLPDGATINENTGKVVFTPNPGQVGDYVITYVVNDGETSVEKNALIKVEITPTPPIINLELTPSFPAIPGQKVIINPLADSFTDIADVSVTVNGEELFLDNLNRGEYIPKFIGRYEVVATVTDTAGRTSTITDVLKVRDVNDTLAPVVNLDFNNQLVTSNLTITATVDDNNLDAWILSINHSNGNKINSSSSSSSHHLVNSPVSPLSENQQLPIAFMNQDMFVDGKIIARGNGTFDSNQIAEISADDYSNGFYQLTLTAVDITGRQSVRQKTVEINSQSKNNYSSTDVDLTVDFADTSINLIRRYDTLNRTQTGVFGHGWQLANAHFDIQTSPNSQFSILNSQLNNTPFTDDTRLYLTLTNGERVGFTFSPTSTEITGLTYYQPRWIADDGVDYTLTSLDAKLSKAGDRYYDLQTAKPYNLEGEATAVYQLTNPDGTIYHLDINGKVTKQTSIDSDVTLIYTDNGILNPDTGEMVRFVTNSQGKITSISTPDGETINYRYDEVGNLITVSNVTQGESKRFAYNSQGLHFVTGLAEENEGIVLEHNGNYRLLQITKDVGGVNSFTQKQVSGNFDGENPNFYSLSLSESELLSTASGTVILNVRVTNTNELPTIRWLFSY